MPRPLREPSDIENRNLQIRHLIQVLDITQTVFLNCQPGRQRQRPVPFRDEHAERFWQGANARDLRPKHINVDIGRDQSCAHKVPNH